MSDQPQVQAVPTDSAPVAVAPEAPVIPPAVETDSAPVAAPETPVVPVEPAPVETESDKRTKELIAQRKKRQLAEQEAAYWRGVAEARNVATQEPQAQQPQPVEQNPNAPPVAPSLDQYQTFAEYEVAKDEYLVKRAQYEFMQQLQRQQEHAQQEQYKRKQMEVQMAFNQRIEKETERNPEFATAIENVGSRMALPVAELVKQSEVGIDIVKYLNANLAEVTRISQLPPVLAAKEIGLIEAQIKFKPQPEPPKRVSQAPDPIPTVTPVGAPVVDEADLPVDEFIRRRNQSHFKR